MKHVLCSKESGRMSKYEAVLNKTTHLIVFKFVLINEYEAVN